MEEILSLWYVYVSRIPDYRLLQWSSVIIKERGRSVLESTKRFETGRREDRVFVKTKTINA